MDAGKKPRKAPPSGYRWIYRKSFRHYITKKDVFRKDGGYFCFLVKC